ncbi:MAG: hydrogenase [Chloroflexi bacterium]|nr:hydrogenase [Chloroflexota bacterium]
MTSGSKNSYETLASKDLDFILPALGTITLMQDLADNIKLVRVELDDPAARKNFVFEPGQFTEVSVFGVGESPFGLAGAWQPEGGLEFAVNRVGTVTDALFRLDLGDQVGIRGPLGNGFPMHLYRGKDVLVLGGGIGGAPLRPIIQTIFKNRKDYGKVTILWAARTPGLLVFTEEYDDWCAQPDTLMHITVDQAPDGWTHEVGLITTLLEKIKPPVENTITVTCGPPIMIKFAMMSLEKLGFAPEQNWVTLEAKMKCGIGKCGRCNLGEKFICVDGPVFCFSEVREFLESFV